MGGETYATAFCISDDGCIAFAEFAGVSDPVGFVAATTVTVAFDIRPPAEATSFPLASSSAAEMECTPASGIHEIDTMRASAGASVTATLPISSEESLNTTLPVNVSVDGFITLSYMSTLEPSTGGVCEKNT